MFVGCWVIGKSTLPIHFTDSLYHLVEESATAWAGVKIVGSAFTPAANAFLVKVIVDVMAL